jgi:hypothetical protein
MLAVCHDAGGAEIVAAWLRRRDDELTCVLEGPARAVFARTLGAGLDIRAALPPLAAFDLVVCGSSGAADLERHAVRAARAAGVRCVVWLDHWVAYAERFVLDGATVLPDEVWVGDDDAARLAATTLPGADVRNHGNPYLEDTVAEIAALSGGRAHGDGGERILYVTEPTPTAATALVGYLERLAGSAAPPAAMRVRQHPAEPPEKYVAELGAFGGRLPLGLSPGGSLAEDVAWADTVVGCDTMAMVVALAAGRRVISVRPPGGRPLSLPFAEIERLRLG